MSQILITCPGRRQHWPDKELQGSETFLALIFFREISRVLDEEDGRGHWAPRGAPTDWAFQVVLAPIYILPTTRMSAARALWPLLIITRTRLRPRLNNLNLGILALMNLEWNLYWWRMKGSPHSSKLWVGAGRVLGGWVLDEVLVSLNIDICWISTICLLGLFHETNF